jgi:hypothetical protein
MAGTRSRWLWIAIPAVLGFLVLTFVFAPLYRYSSVGLYPNGQAGSITQAHVVAPKTFLLLNLSCERQMSTTFLGRKDVDLPDFIAVHVTCPPGQKFSLVSLEYRRDQDWLVHPKPLQLEIAPNFTHEPYDTFLCLVPLADCLLPPMKTLEELTRVHHVTIRATVRNTSDPSQPTYRAQEQFVLSTFRQNDPLWWRMIRF